MRILIISHRFYPDLGGIEVNSEILARYFKKLGAEVHLITWTKDHSCDEFSFEVVRSPNLFILLKQYQWADIVFENNPTLKLSWPLVFFKKSHVIAIRTLINRSDGSVNWRDKLKFKWLRKASAVIAVSNFIREEVFNDAMVIPNPYRSDLFNRLPTIKKDKDFIFLGRLVSDKGVDMAIELLKLLHSTTGKFSNYQYLNLTIVGDGPEKKRLKQLINKYGLEEFVNLTGFLEGEELNDKLNQHKYLLVPSRWKEPFGNVVLEGMACGCLPFVSDGGGLPQAVGNAGVTFKRGNLKDLFKLVKNVLENPEYEQNLRSNSEEHLSKHQPEIIAKKYFEIIGNTI